MLILRANVALWSFWSFYIYSFKNIYVCIQVYIAPIRAKLARKNVTKMTISKKALSSQHVTLVIHMTNIWPSNDHSLHSICQRECNPATHDQNDQGLNVYLVYVNMLTFSFQGLVDIRSAWPAINGGTGPCVVWEYLRRGYTIFFLF